MESSTEDPTTNLVIKTIVITWIGAYAIYWCLGALGLRLLRLTSAGRFPVLAHVIMTPIL